MHSCIAVCTLRFVFQNERVSFSIARPSDLWFHADGIPGGHVLLRGPEGGTYKPTREEMAFAADCAAYFSKARGKKQCRVVCVQARTLVKPPGSSLGTVQVKAVKAFLLSE